MGTSSSSNHQLGKEWEESVTGIFIGNEGGIHDVCKSHKGRVILGSELFTGTQKGEENSFIPHCFPGKQGSGKIHQHHHSTGG